MPSVVVDSNSESDSDSDSDGHVSDSEEDVDDDPDDALTIDELIARSDPQFDINEHQYIIDSIKTLLLGLQSSSDTDQRESGFSNSIEYGACVCVVCCVSVCVCMFKF